MQDEPEGELRRSAIIRDMDAMTVLDNVAATYRGLRTFAADVRAITESGDEGSSHRSEARISVLHVAPDRVRIEQPGRQGVIDIADGVHLHHYIAPMKRYVKLPVDPGAPLPGFFRPEFPGGGSDFLFHRIAERVLEARVITAPGVTIEVRYETFESTGMQRGPVQFVVDPETWLVRRRSCTVSLQDHQGGWHTQVLTTEFDHTAVNESIPANAFDFIPPPDAIDMSRPEHQGGFGFGSGGGESSGPMPGGGTFQHRSSLEWEGETLVERATVRIKGVEAAIERRFTLETGRHLLIEEKIRGPKSEVSRELTLPLE